MTRLLNRIALAASLALGAPAVAGIAHAEEDIRLPAFDAADPVSATAFRESVDKAAAAACHGATQTGSHLDRSARCREAFWDEVTAQLSAAQKRALETTAAPFVSVAHATAASGTGRR